MELRHLRYFTAVAASMSVTRAAEALGLAQPALTQQLKALESEVGVALLRRVGRGIALTPAGERFAADARAILAESHAAVLRAQQVARGDIGRLAVGMTESAAFVPQVVLPLRRFRIAYPEVSLVLSEGRSEELARALAAGSIDAAFVRPPVPDEGVGKGAWAVCLIHNERLVAAVATSHPLASRRRIWLTELAGETLIWPRRRSGGGGISDLLFAMLREEGVTLAGLIETQEFTTALNLAAANLGVALVPESLGSIRPDAIAAIALAGARNLRTEIALATRPDVTSPPLENLKTFFPAATASRVARRKREG